MRTYLLLLLLGLTTGCATSDIATMDATTVQQFNLNDDDKDGVIVARDRCTGTVIGAQVDNYGCGKIKNINERQELKILFASNSFEIDPQYYDQIEVVAKTLKRYPQAKVTIEGHCSNTGSYELNLALSQNRAKAVTDVLMNTYGIESERLTAIGYSFDRPIDTSNTPEARTRNRRVVAEVFGDDTIVDMKWHIYTVDEEEQ